MSNLLSKVKTFQYNSFQHVNPDQPVFTLETDDCVLIGEHEQNRTNIYWACNTIDDLVETLSKIDHQVVKKEIMIQFIPLEFVEGLKKCGFNIISEWIDFWIHDLQSIDLKNSSVCTINELQDDEIVQASIVSQSCKGISREFYGENESTIKEWMLDSNTKIFKAIDNNQIVGICVMIIYEGNNKKIAWLRELAVIPNYQGRGIGNSLIKHGLLWAIKQGAVKSFLATDVENHHAIKLYEQLGYVKQDGVGQINMAKSIL